MTVVVLGLIAASAADQAGTSTSPEGCPSIPDSVKLWTSGPVLTVQDLA